MPTDQRIVVVGGGIAGYTLVSALRARGQSGPITVIEGEPAMYDRPPLSKAAIVGEIGLDDLVFATAEQLEALRVEVRCGRRATALHPDDGRVVLDDGSEVVGDVIVVATGGKARPLPVPGCDHPAVHVLRTHADAESIRAAARPRARILVVGGGLIGAELTSSLRLRGVDVTLIDPMAAPLEPAVGAHLAARLHAMHEAHGVDVRQATLVRVDPSPGPGATAELSDGDRLAVDAVVAGVGMEPDTVLAEAAGLAVDGGVLVDAEHRTSHPRVRAIGDVARRRNPDGSLRRRHEHWESAQLDAQELAAALSGEAAPERGAPWWWSDRYGMHVEGVGRMSGPGHTILRGEDAAFHLHDGYVVGAASLGASVVVRAARQLIDQRVPVAADALADPTVSLRSLLTTAATR